MLPSAAGAARADPRKGAAALIRVVDLTAIRVGHEEYTRANRSFGLTTLRSRHVRIRGAKVQLSFRGKSGVSRALSFEDRLVARVFAQCRALGGAHLFKFRAVDGRMRRVNAEHVNEFLRELMGDAHSIKDFRTWSATVCVAVELARAEPAPTQRARKQQLLAASRLAAAQLGNTPAICRKSYVHPLIVEAYTRGHVLPTDRSTAVGRYRTHEASVRRFLMALMRTATPERRKAS